MTGRFTINGIDFQAAAVPGRTAEAVLSDPVVAQGVWRDVYRWDARTQTGRVLVPVTKSGATPLPNAITFYIPKVTADGVVIKNTAASGRMAERFLRLIDASSVTDVAKAVTGLVQQPQKVLPLEDFEQLNPVVSYVVRMHLGLVVVQLRHVAEDLSAYLALPSRVSFHHEIEAIIDPEGYAALVAADRGIKSLVVSMAVPSRSAANTGLRRLALRHRIEELRTGIDAALPIRDAEAGRRIDHLRDRLGEAEEEWEALTVT
jgi:hypothetical protein